MAYPNSYNNASFYSASSAPGEFEAYPFLGQTSAIEGNDVQAYHPPVDPWSMAGQPRHLVGSSPSYGKYICNIFVERCPYA